jgi:hypothetical protein
MADLNADDGIENELATAFRPEPVSPELRVRIGVELGRRRSGHRLTAFAGLAAAGCVAAGLAIWTHRTPPSPAVGRAAPSGETVSVTPASAGAAPVSIMDYQRAIAESPRALDALLSRPAPNARRAQPQPVTAFSRSTVPVNK